MARQSIASKPVGTTIKINEFGSPVEYIIVHHGRPSDMYSETCDGTWVWRVDQGEARRYADSSTAYSTSEINAHLNGDFLDRYDEDFRNAIKDVKIPSTYANYSNEVNSGENGLPCKAFILGYKEMGAGHATFDSMICVDGAVLDYFKEDAVNRRKGNRNLHYWTRSSITINSRIVTVSGYGGSGNFSADISVTSQVPTIRPALILPSTVYVDDDGSVVLNQPPTAPGSINVTNVVAGNKAAIAVTAATDPDGTIASYIYDRSVDGSAWQQIANVNARSYQDMVSADWGTVAYRVCAVDNDGASGPYVTSNTSVVNSGWVILSGPADAMGSKPAPFEFAVTPSISGVTQSSNISVEITLDGVSVYSQAVRAGTEITVGIDTRIMKTGNHSIVVTGTCAGYVPASKEYTFSVPSIDLSDGGRLEQLEGPDGQAIFPVTLPRAVVGLDVYGVESKVHSGAYTGSGTYGSGNRNTLNFDFEPKLVIIQGTSGRTAILTKPSGIGVSIGPSDTAQINVTWNGNSVSWYSRQNAANQMNTNSESYSYTAFG